MSIVIDTYPLGQLQTNCYVVRTARGAAEAAVIDPAVTQPRCASSSPEWERPAPGS